MLRIAHAPVAGSTGHDTAYALLTKLYTEETGAKCPEIIRTPGQKPRFCEGNLHFSVSHTDHFAFCALSDRPVGIDAEELTRRVKPALVEKILSPAEYARYEACPDKNEALLRFWVLKEAMAKFTGEGLRGYPNKTDFRPDDPRIQVLSDCLVAVIQEESHVI